VTRIAVDFPGRCCVHGAILLTAKVNEAIDARRAAILQLQIKQLIRT
jgi:hypothetical protein